MANCTHAAAWLIGARGYPDTDTVRCTFQCLCGATFDRELSYREYLEAGGDDHRERIWEIPDGDLAAEAQAQETLP